MEIEPEVIPPESRSRDPRPIAPVPKWKLVLAGVAGVAFLCLMLWLAFWFAVVLLGLALIGGLIRLVVNLVTGGSKSFDSSSNFQITIDRGPRSR